ncbi:unnamed protein product [Oikopleura dioica]|uniref:Uncharacterized protein n=1 Tax=Oikopleura dioica TaxID=34765 RepID=E4Y151_OIKDI|nr:unnamed protein product [Oikopleura dioica]
MNLFSSLLASTALADVYMHFPRGSNNRLNENSEVRRNGNRLFDSQNNNEGGYNVGDKFDKPAEKAEEQSKAVFFESTTEAPSELAIESWNQHGCGRRDADDANWVNCQIVLQYMCEDSSSTKIKNGLNTNTNAYTHPGNGESVEQYRERRRRDTTDGDHGERGVHESWEYYDSCYKRDRNYRLFTGNEARVRGGAIYTRQNPGGERRGYECPEERDYYPYWHPTPWKDIAVLTSEPGKCTDLLDENAQPLSGNQPVIIQQKKSNTCCIVTLTVICLCVVIPIIIVVALFGTAVTTITDFFSWSTSIIEDIPSENISEDNFNLIFNGSSIEFAVQ